jgi:hypothetical protein
MTAKVFDPEDPAKLVRGWELHAAKARRKHEKAALHLDRKRYLIGALVIIASAVVGASIISSLEAQFGPWVTIAVGFGSIFSAILASLQTFLGYAERSEQHRSAGVEYKAVIRALEVRRALCSSMSCAENVEYRTWLDEMRARLDELERKTPIVPYRIDRSVEKEYSDVTFVQSPEELHG